MKKTKISLLLSVITLGIAFCQNSQAILLPYLVEPFNYSVNGKFATVAGNGATGLTPGWAGAQPQITYTNGDGSLDGSSLGLQASTGDKLWIQGFDFTDGTNSGGANGDDNVFVTKGYIQPTWTAPTNLVYTSFLFRFNQQTDVPQSAVAIAIENRQNSSFYGTPASIHWRLMAQNDGAGNIKLGLSKNNDGVVNTHTNYSSTNITQGQIFFVVIRQCITNGVPEYEDLWVNPSSASFGAAEGSVPPISAYTTNGVDDSSTSGVGRFWVVDSGCDANIDEVRIAPTWALVTPAYGSCTGASITTDLTNITQSAEISVTMSGAAGLSTTPLYQWQRCTTNGFGTAWTNQPIWTNIPGATASTYTSQNLQTNDNGAMYHMVVTVPCDGSQATTSVSTVRVTPPVVSANALIMDDTFADSLVNNTPVTSDNSTWYSASDSQIYVDGDTGYMDCAPIAGTSTLYLGYFVDESTTNLPTDLAVGHAITVTLPFNTGNFNDAFTNNGALRFGLFDYADGGTLIKLNSTIAPNAVTGSAGNGIGVRGYMLSVDFGTNFSSSSPLSLYTRFALTDNNLMGTTDDYLSMGGGPSGGGYTGAPAFKPNTSYTLTFTVNRLNINGSSVSATITGGGTNWTFSAGDTNNYGYHRFDSFAIRANEAENFVDLLSIPEFKVAVTNCTISPTNISISGSSAITNVSKPFATVHWTPSPAGVYTYSVVYKTNLTDATWITLATNLLSSTYIDQTATAGQRFYRVTSP